MDLTEMPYAEDFMSDLFELLDKYRDKDMDLAVMVKIMKIELAELEYDMKRMDRNMVEQDCE